MKHLLFLLALPLGAQVHLACGGDLQSAINAAVGPQTITVAHLAADGITRCKWGSYTLPYRADRGVVTISTDAPVPAFGVRTHPGDSYLALFVSTGLGTYYQDFIIDQGVPRSHPVHGYKFVGLEMTAPNDTKMISYGILNLSPAAPANSNTYTPADIPYGFTVDHCYIHGASIDQQHVRGISANASDVTILDSEISEIHSDRNYPESQAIWGCSQAGNWVVENNDIEGAGENFLFCGNVVGIGMMAATDKLTFRYNYVHKPPAWFGYVDFQGSQFWIKNLFEMKAGTHALIDSNVFEYSFYNVDQNFAILFTQRNSVYTTDGKTFQPNLNWTVSNVIFTNNTVRHSISGISLSLYDNNCQIFYGGNPARCFVTNSHDYLIQNNFFDDLSVKWGATPNSANSTGIKFDVAVQGGRNYYTHNMTLDHNTFKFGTVRNTAINASVQTSIDYLDVPGGCSVPFLSGKNPPSDFVITYNMLGLTMLRDCAEGPSAVFPGSTFHHNTIGASFEDQAAWDAVLSPKQKGNLINSTANRDGRGANLAQLSALEALIKAGRRPEK